MPIGRVNNAIILAAGRGRRLGLMTVPFGNTPAPALPVCNRPNINRIIEQAINVGVKNIFIIEHHMAGHIQNVVGFGQRFSDDVDIQHIVENPLHDTAGGTLNVLQNFDFKRDVPFWVLGSTVSFPTADLASMYEAFTRARDRYNVLGCIGFVLRPAHEVVNRYGVASIDNRNLIQRFFEKPASIDEALAIAEGIKNDEIKAVSDKLGVPLLPVNASYYLLMQDLFNVADPSLKDFGSEVFPATPEGLLYAHIMEEGEAGEKQWTHIVIPERYWLSQWRLMKHAPKLIPGVYSTTHSSWINSSAVIRDGAQIHKSVIGDRCYIGSGCTIENSIIGPGSILNDIQVKASVLLPFSYANQRVFTERCTHIEFSVVGGRAVGGTFIDNISLPGTIHYLRGEYAIPTEDRRIESTKLELSEADEKEPFLI